MTHFTGAGRRHRRALLPAIAAVPLLALVAGCGGGAGPRAQATSPTTSTSPAAVADPAVEVVGLPDGTTAEVTDSQPGDLPREYISFISPVFSVTPTDVLPAPVVVRVRLDNAVPRSTPVFVATRPSESQGSTDDGFSPGSDPDPTPASPSSSPSSSPTSSQTSSSDASAGAQPGEAWAWTQGRLTSDLRHVEFTTTRLGDIGAVTVDQAPVLAQLRTDVGAALKPGLDRSATAPTCTGESDALQDGYTFEQGAGGTLGSCFGLEGRTRVLRVTNLRDVPVEVTHAGLPVVPGSTTATPAAWLAWVSALDGAKDGPTVLAPGSSAAYAIDLKPSSDATLSTTSGARAVTLRVLRATVGAVTKRLELFGTGAADGDAVLAALVAKPPCAAALERRADGLVQACLSPTRLARALGTRSLLVDDLLATKTVRASLRQQVETVTAQVADTEQQDVAVRRGAADFSTLAGRFTANGRMLTIGARGVVTERVTNGPQQPVIELTYELTDPTLTSGMTTASAKLTKVTLYDKALFAGRVPQVGDTGTLAVVRGVVTPPFLSTSYCDAEAGKRSACG